MDKPKVVFDARMYGLEHGGIGRYVMNLVENIKPSNHRVRIVLLVRGEKLPEIKKVLGERFEYIPLKARHYSLREQLEVFWVLKKTKPDLVHFPHFNMPFFYQGKYVVTIHDLIKHFFRGRETTTRQSYLYWLKYFGYRMLVRKVIRGAEAVIVPTYWWKRKLRQMYRLSPEKIFVTGEGVSEAFLASNRVDNGTKRSVLEKYRLEDGKFLIYTGSAYPHKNLERLFKALALVRRRDLGLVIVCSRDIFRNRLEKKVSGLKIKKRVKFLEFVPDEELRVLYQSALALVQPSLMEGFGLPGLEAMSCGCPVISSSASCLPEVYGKAALYFDPYDAEDMAGKIRMVIGSKKLREKMAQKGKEQVAKYSWKKAAQKTIKVYLRALYS